MDSRFLLTVPLAIGLSWTAEAGDLAKGFQNAARLSVAQSVPAPRLSLAGRTEFLSSLRAILSHHHGAEVAATALARFEAPDTGATAVTYDALVALLPTSAETILRSFKPIAATEKIPADRLTADILARVAGGSGPVAKSSQTPPAVAAALTGNAGIGAAAALGALALGVVGSAGSSSPACGTICDGFLTEYNQQYGLGMINAADLNNEGFTGAGVKVAVNDSGIDATHSEFSGRTILGADFTGGGSFATDGNGHGTHVASTIGGNRDQTGMRGVAYDVDLYSYKLLKADGYFANGDYDTIWSSSITQHITDGIKVSNNSWGSSFRITDVTPAFLAGLSQTEAAFTNALAAGTIFVWANGNDGYDQPGYQAGLPYVAPGFASQWLSVTAVDQTGTEASFTNRCGVAWDTCVTAPGVSIVAARTGGGYTTLSGTSMAAPHVSGLVALLIQKFPSLTPAQIVERVKTTSSYTGLTARDGCTDATCTVSQMRAIFGHGLINQAAAVKNIGALNLAQGSNVFSGANVNLSASALRRPAGLGSAAVAAIGDTKIAVFDSFDGATFAVSGGALFNDPTVEMPRVGYVSASSSLVSGRDNVLPYTVLSNGALPGLLMSQVTGGINVASLAAWGDKATFLPSPEFLKAEALTRFEMLPTGQSSLEILPYAQLNRATGHWSGLGVNVVMSVDQKTQLIASVGRSNEAFDFDLTGNDGQRADVDIIELGFRHSLAPTVELFGRMSQNTTRGFSATTKNWGLRDATFNRSTFGVELKAKGGAKLALGLINAGSFDAGTVSLQAATGRTTAGAVMYSDFAYDASTARSYAPFLALKMPMTVGGALPAELTLALQGANAKAASGRADLSFAIRF